MRAQFTDDWAGGDPAPATPELAAALGPALPGGRACAVRVEDGGGVALWPGVMAPGRLGPAVELMPYELAAGPIVLEGAPGVPDPVALRRALRAQRVSLSVHHSAGAAGQRTTHVVELADGRPRPRERARRRLKAAARAGVEVGDDGSAECLIAILAAAGRLHHPPDLLRAVATCGAATVIVGRRAGRDVSAALALHSRAEVLYWLGATLPGEEEHSPSHPVIDALVELGVQRGARWVDLGSSDGLPGVAFFKEGFGAEPRPSARLVAASRRQRAVSAVLGR